MMKYSLRRISGDAGEFLVAYTVTRKLGWPCRLMGIDIGIDAEIEVLDDSRVSHGDVIKVQIKSLAKLGREDKYIYVSDNHIQYWKNFSAPIIVCCVDHSTGAVYWQSIYQSEPYSGKGRTRRLTFNAKKSQKLDSSSKESFRDLVSPPEAKNFTAELDILRTYIIEWRGITGINGGPGTGGYLNEQESKAYKIRDLTNKLREASTLYPYRFSPADKKDIESAASTASQVIRWVDEASKDQFY